MYDITLLLEYCPYASLDSLLEVPAPLLYLAAHLSLRFSKQCIQSSPSKSGSRLGHHCMIDTHSEAESWSLLGQLSWSHHPIPGNERLLIAGHVTPACRLQSTQSISALPPLCAPCKPCILATLPPGGKRGEVTCLQRLLHLAWRKVSALAWRPRAGWAMDGSKII